MNKQNKLLLIVVFSLLLITSLCTIVFAFGLDEPQWASVDMQEEYLYGTQINIPQRNVSISGKTYNATSVVVYPDGNATTQTTINANLVGTYNVVYTATVDGKTYTDTVCFKVNDAVYTVSNPKSSVTYGKHSLASKSGLLVRLAEGDTLTFTQAIDIKDVTSTDFLVDLFVTPDFVGASDFEKLVFTFTDAYNPEIQIKVSATKTPEAPGIPYTYFLAGGNGQDMRGYESWWKKVHVGQWGEKIQHSFSLNFGEGWSYIAPDETPIRLAYDSFANAIYARDALIIDFDNPDHFPVLWEGFQSDKVFLSISGELYSGQTANFCITNVRGIDLQAEKFVDNVGPQIELDCNFETMPQAQKDLAYPVPQAQAYDLYSGSCKVETTVWYAFGSNNAVMVQVNDGKFVPKWKGMYSITYDAMDKLGNLSTKVLYVNCVDNTQPPVISLTQTPETTVVTGSAIMPVEYNVQSQQDCANVSVFATLGEEKFDMKNGFIPEKAGTYTIHYLATDYIGKTDEETYQVEVKVNDAPLFLEQPNLPKYFIEGAQYQLQDFYAFDFRSGKKEQKLTTVTISDNNGNKVITSSKVYVPSGNLATITFYCDNAKPLVKEVPIVKVWDNSGSRPILMMEKYFAGTGFSSQKSEEQLTISLTNKQSEWTFINPILANSFQLVLKGIAGQTKFDSFEIILTDMYDDSQQLIIAVRLEANKTYVRVGNTELPLNLSFDSGAEFEFGFSNNNIKIGTGLIAVSTYADGSTFQGFTSDKVYVSMKISNGKVGGSYAIKSVSGTPITSSIADRIGPKVLVLGEHGGVFAIGDIVIIPPVIAGDVLDSTTKVSVSVVSPSGAVVKDINGVELKDIPTDKAYQIKIEEYGQYKVRIVAVDTFNARPNETPYTYTINVDDNIAPTIQFAHPATLTAKVGDTIVLPNFTVTDNISASDAISVEKFCVMPSGQLVLLPSNSNSVKCTQAGIYQFRVIVYDEAGNMTMEKITINVEEE